MADWQRLSVERHGALRVRPAVATGRHFVQVVPAEFARVAVRCPILLTKHPETGNFYAGALFGFAVGENLLADATGELELTPPCDIERQGCFVDGDALVIDRADPRFAEDAGQPLFDGTMPADALRRIQQALTMLHHGLAESAALIAAWRAHGLVEAIDLSFSFDDGERRTLDGLYTISRDALGALSDSAVATLFRANQLQPALLLAESLNQLPLLAWRRNRRLAA